MVRDRSSADALQSDVTVLSVQPRGAGWAVEDKGSLFGGALRSTENKSDAMDFARSERKRQDGPVKIEVLKKNGSVQKTIGP